MTEAPKAAPAGEKEKPFDRKAALTSAGFKEFLTKFDDADSARDLDDAGMAERYKMFEKFNEVRGDLQDLFAKQIKEELDIRLDKAGKEAIDSYLMDQAINSPDRITELLAKVRSFKQDTALIKSYQERLGTVDTARLTKEKGMFENDQRAVQTIEGKKGWLDSAEVKRARQYLQNRYGKKEGKDLEAIGRTASDRLDSINAGLTAPARMEAKRAAVAATRTELLASVLEDDKVARAIGNAAQERLNKLAGGKGLEAVQKSSEYYAKFAKLGEVDGISDEFFANREDTLTPEFDKKIETKARAEVKTAIEAVNWKSKGAMARLQKSLGAFINANPIGTKEHDEAREFVEEVLEDEQERLVADWENADTDKKVKHVMIGIILGDMDKIASGTAF